MTRATTATPDRTPRAELPPVAELLQIDREYRRRSEGGMRQLKHGVREYLADFSSSPLAHRFHRTRDWVVLRYHEEDGSRGHDTIVTARLGPMKGRRVVRGRELECFAYYRDRSRDRPLRRVARSRAAASAA